MNDKPRGKALDWSDEDIDKLAEVSEADIAAAAQEWRDTAPPGFEGLLDAEPMEDDGSTV